MSDLIEKFGAALEIDGLWIAIILLVLYLYQNYRKKLEETDKGKLETSSKIIEHFNSNCTNLYIRELIFENHFKKIISHHEISYFMASRCPNLFLHRFLGSRRYLEVSANSFNLNFKNNKPPKKSKILYLALYWVFGVAGMLMLFATFNAFEQKGPAIFAPWIIVNFTLFGLAFMGLVESISASIAIGLMAEIYPERS